MTSGTVQLIPVRRFSTDNVAAPERFDAWRGQGMAGTRAFETRTLEPFGMNSTFTVLDDIIVSFARYSAKDWYRTPELIRADGLDLVAANVRFMGTADGEAQGDPFLGPSGSIVFLDMSRPQAHRSSRSDTAMLLIPRAVAEQALGPTERLHGLVVPPARATLLRTYLRELERTIATIPASQASRLRQVTLDLLAVAVALAQTTDGGEPAPRAVAIAARRRAEATIEERLASATLTVANLCRWVGVSRSTLYRLFDEDGGVQAYIRARRLARVADDLRRGASERIGDIAERWGFCDSAYLARLFREEHGLTPGEYRALHVVADDVPG